jgi:hypothetical protein
MEINRKSVPNAWRLAMQRHTHLSSPVEEEWTFVSLKRPCKICGRHEGCRSGYGGRFAGCLQRASERPLITGGWLHRTDFEIAETHPREITDSGSGPRADLACPVRIAS